MNHDLTLITLGAPAGLGVAGAARIVINGSICVIRERMYDGINPMTTSISAVSVSVASDRLALHVPLSRVASANSDPPEVPQVSRSFSNVPTQPLVRTSVMDLDVFWDASAANSVADRAELLVPVRDTHFIDGLVATP
mgnify:CR=1 FL=1